MDYQLVRDFSGACVMTGFAIYNLGQFTDYDKDSLDELIRELNHNQHAPDGCDNDRLEIYQDTMSKINLFPSFHCGIGVEQLVSEHLGELSDFDFVTIHKASDGNTYLIVLRGNNDFCGSIHNHYIGCQGDEVKRMQEDMVAYRNYIDEFHIYFVRQILNRLGVDYEPSLLNLVHKTEFMKQGGSFQFTHVEDWENPVIGGDEIRNIVFFRGSDYYFDYRTVNPKEYRLVCEFLTEDMTESILGFGEYMATRDVINYINATRGMNINQFTKLDDIITIDFLRKMVVESYLGFRWSYWMFIDPEYQQDEAWFDRLSKYMFENGHLIRVPGDLFEFTTLFKDCGYTEITEDLYEEEFHAKMREIISNI